VTETNLLPDFFSDPGVIDQAQDYYRQARAICPALRESHHGAVMVTGYDAAMEVLSRQADRFSSCNAVTGPLPPLPFDPQGDDIRDQISANRSRMPWTDHLVTMDGPYHQQLRALLQQLLTHTRLKANEDYLRGLVDRLVRRLVPLGGVEVTRGYAHALSTLVIADLLGVPEGDRDELVNLMGLPPTQLGGDSAEKALTNPLTFLFDRFAGYIEQRRRHPRGDFLSDLAQARLKDGSAPDPEVPVRLATFMFGAGQDTSARLIAFSFQILGEDPELQAWLRDDPSRISNFVEEVLRLENPVKTLSRLAVKPADVAGTHIPAGTVVTVCIGGVNRDPAHFAEPDRFNAERQGVRDHISFSRGAHACIGAPLARLETRLTLERFLETTRNIRISEKHHGPAGARDYKREPTYLLNGLRELHVQWDPA
jgi:cytochrome P450